VDRVLDGVQFTIEMEINAIEMKTNSNALQHDVRY